MKYGWTTDQAEWASLPQSVVSGKWSSVKFFIGSSNSIPNTQGVYMFCAYAPKNVFTFSTVPDHPLMRISTPVYVGRSNNLRRRFKEHFNTDNDTLKKIISCYTYTLEFLFLRLDCDIEELKSIEDSLIRSFGPMGNNRVEIKGTIGDGIPVC